MAVVSFQGAGVVLSVVAAVNSPVALDTDEIKTPVAAVAVALNAEAALSAVAVVVGLAEQYVLTT